jgi:biopolymer transport protein TolQ
MDASSAVSAVAAATPEVVDFSLLHLFLSADILVKVVMIGLLGASVWCWAIIVDKSVLYGRVNRQMNAFERVFWSGQSLEELYQSMQERASVGMGAIFVAAMKEWKRSHEQNAASYLGVQQRLDKVLDVAISRESEGLEKRLGFLATVASSSPFIGLFGTVWGIMNSFTSIAASKSTNLAVVAPGIAEALFATALGLLAAIPATIAYNKLSGDSNKLISRLESFADEFSTILSRQLEARSK